MKTEEQIREQIRKMEDLVKAYDESKEPPDYARVQHYHKAQRSIAALKWVLEP